MSIELTQPQLLELHTILIGRHYSAVGRASVEAALAKTHDDHKRAALAAHVATQVVELGRLVEAAFDHNHRFVHGGHFGPALPGSPATE